jgi:hypothetical protein
MATHIFTVNDVFEIVGRGVAVAGQWHETGLAPGTTIAQVGDAIELRFPDGKSLPPTIAAISYPRRDIILPPPVTRGEISPGIEIWKI